MVYCAHCGTQNRDGSKFCSNCGARLASESGLRCPMCSTLNQVESVFCSNCSARLVPLIAAAIPEAKPPAPPIKGLSLSAKTVLPADELPTPNAAPAEPSDLIAPPPAAQVAGQKEAPRAEAKKTTPDPAETGGTDWLARLRAATPAEPEPEEEIPDWLQQSPADSAGESPITTATEAEIPNWLKQTQSESATKSPDAPIAENKVPDWLMQPEIDAAPITKVTSVSGEKNELPDWLREPVTEKEIEAASAVPEKAAQAPSLEPTQPEEISQIEPAEPLLESLEAAEISIPASAELTPAVASSDIDDLPDWLRTAAPAPSSIAPAQEIEPPLPAEVPAWVAALKPAEISSATPAAELENPELEAMGPLARLRGVLPLAAAIAEPHPAAETPKPPSQTEGGQIFESILATSAEAGAPAAKPARRRWTMRPFIYLLLFLAVLVPFILPYDLTGATFNIAGTPAAEFFDTLQQKVPANSTVLLSFDYDPSAAGEMDLLAKAVVRDLVKRRVKIIAVSTLETGPQIARRILDDAAREASNYTYGSSYVIVYLPGHEAGLAQLAATGLPTGADFVEQKPIAPFLAAVNIKTLSDLPMVIEFAGSEEPLKIWVEQVQPRAGVRIAAAVSAAVEPKARAYRNANQLTAMLSGLLGAAQYEVLSSQPGLAVISVNAQTAAQFVLVFVILLGNVVFWISRARGNAK